MLSFSKTQRILNVTGIPTRKELQLTQCFCGGGDPVLVCSPDQMNLIIFSIGILVSAALPTMQQLSNFEALCQKVTRLMFLMALKAPLLKTSVLAARVLIKCHVSEPYSRMQSAAELQVQSVVLQALSPQSLN